MSSGHRAWCLTFALAALLAGAAGCSDSKSGAEHFVGTWTYAGMITPNCGTTAVNPIDLTGYSATITEIDSSHITVALGTVCTVKFDVDGFSASAEANQSCMFDVGTFGPQTVSITKWTLKSTGADTLTSDFSGTAIICTATGAGTLSRVGDAGAVD